LSNSGETEVQPVLWKYFKLLENFPPIELACGYRPKHPTDIRNPEVKGETVSEPLITISL
jgi:hypothetical protein